MVDPADASPFVLVNIALFAGGRTARRVLCLSGKNRLPQP